MVRLIADLHDRIRHLVPELAKFGIVGGTGTVIDLGGAAVLHSAYHQGPLKAKAISIVVATAVTYVGSRYWTFRHRDNQPLLREGTLFAVLNLIGLVIAELVIACTTYVLGFNGPIAYNLASLAGTGLGTIFRYFAYRKWVFLAPVAQPAPVAPAAETGFAALPPWYAEPTEAIDAEPAYVAAPPLAFTPASAHSASAHSAPVAVAPGQAPPWLDQSPPWPRQPAAQTAQAAQTVQAPPQAHRPTVQATNAPPRSSGGRHRKSRSA